MPDLSLETKNSVVYYLGYPGKVLVPGSTHYQSIVNSRMNNLDTYTMDRVETLLEEIAATRTKLSATQSKGNVKKIGDIELDTARGSSFVKNEYRRLLNELSSILDIPNYNASGSKQIGISRP